MGFFPPMSAVLPLVLPLSYSPCPTAPCFRVNELTFRTQPSSSPSAKPSLTSAASAKQPQHNVRRNDRAPPFPPPRITWGQLASGHQRQPPLAVAPKRDVLLEPHLLERTAWLAHSLRYVDPSSASNVPLDATDFPVLQSPLVIMMEKAKQAPTWSAPNVNGRQPLTTAAMPLTRVHSSYFLTSSHNTRTALRDLNTQTGSLSFSSEHGTASTAGGGAASRWTYGGYALAARQVAQPPSQTANSWPALTNQQSDGYGTYDEIGDGEEGWRLAALDELCQSHLWAGRELLEVRM